MNHPITKALQQGRYDYIYATTFDASSSGDMRVPDQHSDNTLPLTEEDTRKYLGVGYDI
jgi:hypothetical protein